MYQYLDLLNKAINDGHNRPDRTGTGTLSLFGHQMRFDLSRGFPLLTTKKLHIKSIIHELLWFLSGSTNISYLKEHGVRIWDEWADDNGDLGPVYGHQWRAWGSGIDQITNLLEGLRRDPYSRRHIVTAWNPDDLPAQALPPCHVMFQFYVDGERLSCHLYQRSGDIFLGIPFNIASYSLLTSLVAQEVGLKPGEFILTIGDAHLYKNHISQAITQLERTPLKLPQLLLRPAPFFERPFDSIEIVGYHAHPHIKADVAI